MYAGGLGEDGEDGDRRGEGYERRAMSSAPAKLTEEACGEYSRRV